VVKPGQTFKLKKMMMMIDGDIRYEITKITDDKHLSRTSKDNKPTEASINKRIYSTACPDYEKLQFLKLFY
jgi:hypothetical protein